jgi:hypothetical protein
VASEQPISRKDSAAKQAVLAFGPVLYVAGAVIVLGAAIYGYLQYADRQTNREMELTPEAKAYSRSLKLTDVEMKATENYMKQRVVEIEGKISNAGDRAVEMVEIFCIFRDPYGQLVLRKRVPIVSARMGGLKPGETKSFRLPFDEIPDSWNQAMPALVIAAVKFS